MPAINPFPTNNTGTISPAIRIIAITPPDADLSHVCRMLYVGTGGDVAVRDLFGTTVIHKNVAGGTYLGPFAVDRVLSTSSTATDILGYV